MDGYNDDSDRMPYYADLYRAFSGFASLHPIAPDGSGSSANQLLKLNLSDTGDISAIITREKTHPGLYDRIYEKIKQSYPNPCIIQIHEIYNKKVLNAFNSSKAKYPNIPVAEVFHGTKYTTAPEIVKNGFLMSYNVMSAYGKGNYFAAQASYSYNYTRPRNEGLKSDLSYMFLAEILQFPQNFENGNDFMRGDGCSIFAVPDHFCYPKYLIQLHLNAP